MRNALAILTALFAVAVFVPSSALGQTPEEEFEKKKEEIDWTNPDQIFEVAKWAAENPKSSRVRKDGRKLMKEVLELDEDHEEARKFLGYVYFDGKWMTKREHEKAMREARKAEMKEKGYIFYKGGWIKKADRREWNKKWEKSDDDVWMSYEDVMRAKGFTFYEGAWLKLSEDDRKRMEHHRKMTGDDVLVTTTDHFKLHLDRSAKWAEKYIKQAEDVYKWYVETFQVAANRKDNLYNGPFHIWTFETTQQFQDWITTYREEYQLSDEQVKRFREQPGPKILGGKRLMCIIAKKPEDLENLLVHSIGQVSAEWQTLFRTPPWLFEAIAHLTEEQNTSEKSGHTSCTTNSKYGGDGGVAHKEFNTKDGRPRCKSIVKAGDERPLIELSMIPLNSLNGDDLSQGFCILDYLYKKRKQDLGPWLNKFTAVTIPKAIAGSAEKINAKVIEETVSSTLAESVAAFENEWRKYVKKYYR